MTKVAAALPVAVNDHADRRVVHQYVAVLYGNSLKCQKKYWDENENGNQTNYEGAKS